LVWLLGTKVTKTDTSYIINPNYTIALQRLTKADSTNLGAPIFAPEIQPEINRVKKPSMQDSMIITSSATVGGLSKAFILGFAQPTITFAQILEVSVYAAISATIGYGIKLCLDWLKKRIRNSKQKQS